MTFPCFSDWLYNIWNMEWNMVMVMEYILIENLVSIFLWNLHILRSTTLHLFKNNLLHLSEILNSSQFLNPNYALFFSSLYAVSK